MFGSNPTASAGARQKLAQVVRLLVRKLTRDYKDHPPTSGIALTVNDKIEGYPVTVARRAGAVVIELRPGAVVESNRTVPLPDVVSLALAEYIRKFPPSSEGLLFHTETGRPHDHSRINNRVFVPATLKAGLPEGTSSHDLRHHYASVLLAAGESVVAVAERLGHDNADLVLSTYGHLLPNLEDRTRKAVDAAWNAATVENSGDNVTAPGRPK